MGRSKKSRPAGRQQPASGNKAKPPATPQEAWQQAIAAYEGGKPRQAQSLLAPLLDMASVPGEVSLLAGLVEAQLGDSRRAEEHLRRAVQMVPERIEGWLGLGNAQHMQGRFDAAVETFRRVLKRSPDSPTALYNMAMAQMDHGRNREALDSLERLLEVDPEWAGAEHNRAILLGILGWAEQAYTAYQTLVSKDPDDPWLRLEFAGFLEQNNRADEAAEWLPTADAFGDAAQGAAQAEGLRAQLLVREERYEEALELLDEAHRRTGQDFLGYRQGNLLDRSGRMDEAMAAFERANRARAKQDVAVRLRSRKCLEYVAEKIERGIASPTQADCEAVRDERRTPVFLVGLPRSGTTLLDRMLGAHPETQVLEEFDTLRMAESAIAAGRSPGETTALITPACRSSRSSASGVVSRPRLATSASSVGSRRAWTSTTLNPWFNSSIVSYCRSDPDIAWRPPPQSLARDVNVVTRGQPERVVAATAVDVALDEAVAPDGHQSLARLDVGERTRDAGRDPVHRDRLPPTTVENRSRHVGDRVAEVVDREDLPPSVAAVERRLGEPAVGDRLGGLVGWE